MILQNLKIRFKKIHPFLDSNTQFTISETLLLIKSFTSETKFWEKAKQRFSKVKNTYSHSPPLQTWIKWKYSLKWILSCFLFPVSWVPIFFFRLKKILGNRDTWNRKQQNSSESRDHETKNTVSPILCISQNCPKKLIFFENLLKINFFLSYFTKGKQKEWVATIFELL